MKKLLLICISIFSSMAFAQQKNVAVYVTGEDAGINKVLGSKLVSAIGRSVEYTAIERTTAFLAELNKEQSYQRTGAVEDNEISRLGKQFGVQYVCVATVIDALNEKYLSARLIDVESAQVERSASSSRTMQSLDDIMSAAEAVSTQLFSNLGSSKNDNSKKVAVYVIKNEAGKDIGRVLGDKLVAGFANSGRYIAVERTNSFLSQLSKEHNYQRTGMVEDTAISRLGRQFGVQYVCVAEVSDVFEEKFISASLIDVETAEVVNSHDAGGKILKMSDCVRLANEIATNLSKATFNEQIEEKAEQERKKAAIKALRKKYIQEGYVDLGLPSGTWWRSYNEKETFTWFSDEWDPFMEKNEQNLPTQAQFEELNNLCTWEVVRGTNNSIYGYKVTGPNGNSIQFKVSFKDRKELELGISTWYNSQYLTRSYKIRERKNKVYYDYIVEMFNIQDYRPLTENHRIYTIRTSERVNIRFVKIWKAPN